METAITTFGILINLFFLFYVVMNQLELCKKFRISHFTLFSIWFIISTASVIYFLNDFINHFKSGTISIPTFIGLDISSLSLFGIVLFILLYLEELIVFRYRIIKDIFTYKVQFQTLKLGLFPVWKPVEKEWVENKFYESGFWSILGSQNIEIEKRFNNKEDAENAIENYKKYTHKKYLRWFFEIPEKDKKEISYY